MKKDPNVLFAWAAAVLYAALIFTLSSMSKPLPEAIQKYFSDWILHGVEYGVFGMLLARAFGLSWPGRPAAWLFGVTLLAGVLYAVSDEWHQSFVPNRQCSFHDVVADAGGILIGCWVWWRKKIA